MKIFKKILVVILTVGVAFVFSKLVIKAAPGTTTPSLGTAETYGVIADQYQVVTGFSRGGPSHIKGDVGYMYLSGLGIYLVGGGGSTYTPIPPQARTDEMNLSTALSSEACDFTFPGTSTVDLDTDVTHIPAFGPRPGVYYPGVYCTNYIMRTNPRSTITLSGKGTYIFRPSTPLEVGSESTIALSNGASACDVFWTPTETYIGKKSTFIGSIVEGMSIIIDEGASVTGRAFVRSGVVSTTSADIIVPSCGVPTTGTITVKKNVVNTVGGTLIPSSFNIHVKSGGVDIASSPMPGSSTGMSYSSLVPGIYTIDEDSKPSYTSSFSGDCDASGKIYLVAGDDKTCTITNTYTPPTTGTLTVRKIVNGGAKSSSDFTIHTKSGGVDVTGSPVLGSISGTDYQLAPANYTISENSDSLYVPTFSGDCDSSGNVTVVIGTSKTCTITNTYVSPIPGNGTINIIKKVINDDGGTANSSSFTIHIKSGGVDVTSPEDGVDTPGKSYFLSAGNYVVSEDADPSYSATFSGDCDSSGNLTLAGGSMEVCTITNDDIAEDVTPDDKIISIPPSDPITPPVLPPPPAPPTDIGYPYPAIVDFVKDSIPSSLPGGPGPVVYTYVMKNVGTVAIDNVTMKDDKCTPVIYVSGDVNNNLKLDVGETWSYKCSTTLTQTTENIGTMQGTVGGKPLFYVSKKTVAVGTLPPPKIHVTETVDKSVLPVGGGIVTYTKKVTNPGAVSLSNINIFDDKGCAITYVSGDTNKDSKLDPNETWTFTCKANVTKTTITKTTSSGIGNGTTVTDFVFTTVAVAEPGLPKTGIYKEDGFPWDIAVISGLTGLSLLFFIAKRKKII